MPIRDVLNRDGKLDQRSIALDILELQSIRFRSIQKRESFELR